MRIERIGPCTLILGDCLTALDLAPVIEPGTLAAVLCDPPYCSGSFTESGKRTAKNMGVKSERLGWFQGDNMTTIGLQWMLRALAVESSYLLREGGTASFFTDWRMIPSLAPAIESAGLRWQQLVVWDKGSAGLGAGFRAQHEVVLHFSRGTPRYFSASNGNVLKVKRPRSAERDHPTEKPVGLLIPMIETIAEPGATVLDWTAGSGSTAVACVQVGRACVAVEKDPVFFERMLERVAAAVGQGQLFGRVGSAPLQDGFTLEQEGDEGGRTGTDDLDEEYTLPPLPPAAPAPPWPVGRDRKLDELAERATRGDQAAYDELLALRKGAAES